MADNYLERKMEDLRRGPAKGYSSRPSAHRTGYIQFPFPPKRVVIASDLASLNSIAKAFLKADCKVAVMNSNREAGEKMAHDEGIRYYPVHLANINELSPFTNKALEKAFENLLEAWRDVDILIADSLPVETLLPIWRRHRKRFPYVSSYTCRTIVFGDADIQRLKSLAEGIKTTINVIDLKDSERDLSELIITLSLPGNDVIDGIKIG